MEPDQILDRDGIPLDAVVVELDREMPEGKDKEEKFSEWSDEQTTERYYKALEKLREIKAYKTDHLEQGYIAASELVENIDYSPT